MNTIQPLDAFTELLSFHQYAESNLKVVIRASEVERHERNRIATEVVQQWNNLTSALSEPLKCNVVYESLEPILREAASHLNSWIKYSISSNPSLEDACWQADSKGFEAKLEKLKPLSANMNRVFAPPPPVEAWYTLAVFGHRAVTTLEDDPQIRDQVATLAVRLRSAAATAKVVEAGADYEKVYLALVDWLVGTYFKTAKEAISMPVVKVISLLGQPNPPKRGRTRFTPQELDEKIKLFIEIVRKDPSIPSKTLAARLGVAKSVLYKEEFPWVLIRNFIMSDRDNLPSGYKSKTGELDAWRK